MLEMDTYEDERQIDTTEWFCLYYTKGDLKLSPLYKSERELSQFIYQFETKSSLSDDTRIFKIFKGKEFKTQFSLVSIEGDEKYDLAV